MRRRKPKSEREPPRNAGAAGARGSAEAFSTIVRGMDRSSGEPIKKTEKNTEKTYQGVEQVLEELRKANTGQLPRFR